MALRRQGRTRGPLFQIVGLAAFNYRLLQHVGMNYPGISSMGKLMALALLCTMGAPVLFQPVLMGPPRPVQNSRRRAPIRLRQPSVTLVRSFMEHAVDAAGIGAGTIFRPINKAGLVRPDEKQYAPHSL